MPWRPEPTSRWSWMSLVQGGVVGLGSVGDVVQLVGLDWVGWVGLDTPTFVVKGYPQIPMIILGPR